MALAVIEHSQSRESLSDGPSPKARAKVVGGQKRARKMEGYGHGQSHREASTMTRPQATTTVGRATRCYPPIEDFRDDKDRRS